MKKICFCLVLIFVVVGMVFSGGQRDRGRTVLRLGGVNAIEAPETIATQMMARLVSEKSGGTLEIQVFPASQLGSAITQFEAVSMGTQDMFIDSSTFVGTFLRDRQVDGMFFVFRDAAHFRAFMRSDLNRQLEEDFRRVKGIRIISNNWYRTPRSFASRIPFDAETFQGMLVRVPDIRGYLESVSAMGGNPVQLAWAEVYLGLMQGVVCAAESPPESLIASRLHETVNNIVLTRHLHDAKTVFINDRAWNRLSPEHQRILVESAREAGEWYVAHIEANLEAVMRAFQNEGANLVEIDVGPFRERVARRVQEIEAEGHMWRRGLFQEIQDIR